MMSKSTPSALAALVQDALTAAGVCPDDLVCEGGAKVVVVSGALKDSLSHLNDAPRDNVVMVRVDDASLAALDQWVTAGIAKSRSEAAALFIREGLALRAGELAQLQDAITRFEDAKSALKAEMSRIAGTADTTEFKDKTGRKRSGNQKKRNRPA